MQLATFINNDGTKRWRSDKANHSYEDALVYHHAKQKHPGCKKSARPIRSSIANRYVQPKTLISVEAKKFT